MRARAGTRARREEPVALTARQEEVLRLLERGLTNTEIAAALGISLDGAKFHVSEIIGKLGVATREEAVEAWRQQRGSRRLRSLFAVPVLRRGAIAVAGGGLASLSLTAIALLLVNGVLGGADEEPAAGSAATLACAVTKPDLLVPPAPHPSEPPAGYASGWHGSAALWTMLRLEGEVWQLQRHGGVFVQKTFWWSEKFVTDREPQPVIVVSGRKLDDPARTFIEGGPGTHASADFGSAMLVGISIPSPGCWEIRASYRGAELAYVVLVEED